jgi:diguanylate cyclase (GGDEF)-like protein
MSQLLARLRTRASSDSHGGPLRLLIFAGLLGAGGAVLWTFPLRDARQLTSAHSAPWWGLLLGCYVCSVLYVQVRVHRTTSTLSLTEIPIAVGLFLVDPRVLLLSYLGGVLLGNWTRRGVRPVLDASNLMLDTLTMAVTVLVFDFVGPDPGDPLAPRSILALAAAMGVSGWVIGPLAVNAGIVLYEGAMDRASLMRSTIFQAGATLTNTCLGILTLAMLVYRPLIALVLIPPIALVFAGQLAAAEGQGRASRMEFLYRTNDLLHAPMQMTQRYGELLNACVRAFATERAELIVIPETRDAAVRFFATSRDNPPSIASAPLTFGEQEMLNTLRDHRVISGTHDAHSTPLGLLLEERDARAGTAALLRGHDRLLGMILLIDPIDGSTGMPAQERNLLATVAGQVSVALENGQLADAIRAMAAEKEELEHKALHDPLTQLPNRSLFTETVDKALVRLPKTMRYLAVMFIDLDGFKQVNDTHGHSAGDQLLCCIAARLRQQVRKHDLAARLGGDEFALLLDALRQPEDVRMVAERVVDSLLAPVPLEGVEVRLGGSVGVAVVADYREVTTAEELLRRADMAMYLAKRQGKGRFVVFDAGSREPILVGQAATPAAEMVPAAEVTPTAR